MSLVAYYSSDDEESNDGEETPAVSKEIGASNINAQKTSKRKDEKATNSNDLDSGSSFPIEDDEYDFVPSQTSGLTLPAPKNVGNTATKDTVPTNTTPSVLSALPAPQTKTGQIRGFEESDELEDEVKPKAKELADAPLPPSKQKKKQKVKITVPSLDDYDSDEDQPQKKKLKPAQSGSGLFSLLPAPKHGATKEVGRVLLPHSLTKKSHTTGPAKKSNAKTVSKPSTQSFKNPLTSAIDDSDEDDDTGNFFSLGQEDKPFGQAVNILPEVTEKNKPSGRNSSTGVLHEPSLRGPWLGPAAPASELLGPSLVPTGPSISNQPSTSAASSSIINEDIREQMPSTLEDGPISSAQYDAEYAQNYYPEVGDVQSFIQDEEFLKMQGKRGRGKEEINIIDVHGADQMSEVDLMKHMTEEKDTRSFGKKGKDMPSSQSRKKHQITYLAYQAKERELELKNQWAQNRQTRRQTQSKYGF